MNFHRVDQSMRRVQSWLSCWLHAGLMHWRALSGTAGKNGLSGLPSLADQIDKINTSTESEFLQTGSKLQDFYQKSGEISQISSSVTTLLAGEEITTAIDGLRRISTDMERAADRSKQHSSQLQNLLGLVAHVNAALSGFQKHVQELNILCVLIRIESVHIGRSEAGFDTLADDIKKLAGEIEAKSNAIVESLDLLSKLILQNLSRIMKIEEQQQGQTQTVRDDTTSSLAGLVEQYEKSLSAARRIASSYEDLTRITGEIVFSLQFHDITRQQIEHVSETLRRIAGQSHQAGDGLAEVCELQAKQIRFAGTKLFEAVGGIIENLKSTAEKIGDITGRLQEIAGDSGQAGESFFRRTQEPLAHASDILLKFEEENRELMCAGESISRALSEMSSFVSSIRQLGLAIRLIALNSIVKSSHVGERGAGLAVLANEIHGLSLKTERQTQEISEAFEAITSFAGRLSASTGGREKTSERCSTAGTLESIESLKNSLSETNSLVTSRMAEIEKEAGSLTCEIQSVASGIHVHEIALAAIEKIASGLDQTVIELRADGSSNGQPEEGTAGAELLKQIKQSYTMNSERDLHQQIDSSAAPPASGEAEQACAQTAEIAETADSPQNPEEEDLGDNVELF